MAQIYWALGSQGPVFQSFRLPRLFGPKFQGPLFPRSCLTRVECSKVLGFLGPMVQSSWDIGCYGRVFKSSKVFGT